ncbi:MAG: tyrosine-type recombinase/integrase [Firmicutes bacterium]|nr:tyrosine-type recombinase/integrase [Bacillota bacterium]
MKYEEEFREFLRDTKNASSSTENAYVGDVREFSAFCEGRLRTCETAKNTDVAAFLTKLKDEGRSPSTVNRKMSSVRCYFSFLMNKGYASQDPSVGVKSPKMEKKALDYLSVEQVNSILEIEGDEPRTLRDKALLELMYATGMRASEIAAANLRDVDLKIGFIICSAGSKSRMIPIGKPAVEALTAYIDRGRQVLAGSDRNQSALFLNYQGQRITRQGIWKILKYYGEKAGIDSDLSPQILRNSFAAHMLQNGADLRSLQELMGLEDINAAKLYLSVTKNRIMDVYDRTHPRAVK